MGLGIGPGGVDKGRVPAPGIRSGDPNTALQQVKRCLAPHAAAPGHVVGFPVSGTGSGVDDDDVQRLEGVIGRLAIEHLRPGRERD